MRTHGKEEIRHEERRRSNQKIFEDKRKKRHDTGLQGIDLPSSKKTKQIEETPRTNKKRHENGLQRTDPAKNTNKDKGRYSKKTDEET